MDENPRLNIPVEEYTTPTPLTASPDMCIKEVAKMMRENGFRHVPVVTGTKPIGIISERDVHLLEQSGASLDEPASKFMNNDPVTIDHRAKLGEAVFCMSEKKIGSLIVTGKDGEVAGIFTNTDALNALVEVLRGDIPWSK